MKAERLHADDTPVPVLAKGKTRTGRLWTVVRDDRPFARQPIRRLPSTITRRIARVSIRRAFSRATAGFCRRMPIPASGNCMNLVVRPARRLRQRVGRMRAANSLNWLS